MTPVSSPAPASIIPGAASQETIQRFLRAVRAGQDWFEALLDAIAQWTAPEEQVGDRAYRYLVAQEAFDWLLLAERLLGAVNGLVSTEERDALLFHSRLPRSLSAEQFKQRVGPAKHKAIINYWYGVQAEEALLLAVEHEVRKQRRGLRPEEHRLDDAVYERIYGLTRSDLLRKFREERRLPQADGMSLTDIREFTYWLFKHRLRASDPARVASDTKKALDFLKGLGRESPHGACLPG